MKYRIEIETRTFTKKLFSNRPPETVLEGQREVLRVVDDTGTTSLYNWDDIIACRYSEKVD